MSNLATRVLVALIGIPLILFLTLTGGFPFFLFIALISGLALHEFYRLSMKKGAEPHIALGILLGLCVNAVFLYSKLRDGILRTMLEMGYQLPMPSMAQAFLILFLVFVPMILVVELFRNRGSALLNVAATITGVVYVSCFLGTFIGIRELFVPEDFPVYLHFQVPGPSVPNDVSQTIYRWGGLTVIAVFASIWVCDSAAYFAGRAFGRHKLFPRVSPNKTWEGAVAGFVFAVATFLLARQLVLPYLSLLSAVACGVIVGLFGQIGDLIESLLKRDAGVKDSSALIPGHGGVLDRFDSLMFVAPLLYFYLDFIVF